MKKIFLTISNKFEKLGRQEDIAWYTFDESSYEKVITALDIIQEEEAKEHYELSQKR